MASDVDCTAGNQFWIPLNTGKHTNRTFSKSLYTVCTLRYYVGKNQKSLPNLNGVRPLSSVGALNLLITTPNKFGLFFTTEEAPLQRSFNSTGVSVAGAVTKIISASNAQYDS